MTLNQWTLIIYALLPAVFGILSLFPWSRISRRGFVFGIALGILRILLLLGLFSPVWLSRGSVSVAAGFVESFGTVFSLRVTPFLFLVLLSIDLSFVLSFLTNSFKGQYERFMDPLVCFAQGALTLQAVSDGLVIGSVAQILSAVFLFFLIRFSLEDEDYDAGEYISKRVLFLFCSLACLSLIWSVGEFAAGATKQGALLSLGAPVSGIAIFRKLWLAGLLIAVPLSPWSRWFHRAVEKLPEGITVPLVSFVCLVILQSVRAFDTEYVDLKWKYKLAIYGVGLISCLYSISALFAENSKRTMMGFLPKFFFALILMSVGVSENRAVPSAYLICVFVPLFTGLILYASVLDLSTIFQRLFTGMFLMLLFGIPGTPVYQIFAFIGARSVNMGAGFMLAFALMWFLYFCANVHICRRMFMDEKPADMGVVSVLTKAPLAVTAYAIFLVVLLAAISVVFGRGI